MCNFKKKLKMLEILSLKLLKILSLNMKKKLMK